MISTAAKLIATAVVPLRSSMVTSLAYGWSGRLRSKPQSYSNEQGYHCCAPRERVTSPLPYACELNVSFHPACQGANLTPDRCDARRKCRRRILKFPRLTGHDHVSTLNARWPRMQAHDKPET